MDIAILGGRGFVGSQITKQLRDRGHAVTTMDPHVGGDNHVAVSILDEHLDEHLTGYDTVINLVGLSPVKQPRGPHGYHDLHVAGAENVVGACETNNISHLVHMSAMGADPEADQIVSKTKGLGEQAVRTADVAHTTVFKPSIIYDTENELVETARKFAPTRMFPNISMQIQPVYRSDVADLFVKAVEGDITTDVVEVGGPDKMTLFDFVKQIYNVRGYRCIPLPLATVIKIGGMVMEYVPYAPVGKDQVKALSMDNTTDTNDAANYIDLTSYSDWVEKMF